MKQFIIFLLLESMVVCALTYVSCDSQERDEDDADPGSHTSLLQSSIHYLGKGHSLRKDASNKEVHHEHELTIGACLRPTARHLFKYKPDTFANYTDKVVHLTPKTILEFDRGPWPGIYNPAIVELPPVLQELHAPAKFAMTVRRDLHQCQNLQQGMHGIPEYSDRVDGLFLLMDQNYCVLQVSPLTVSGHVPRQAQDVRLFVEDDILKASFVMWQFSPTRYEGKGLWYAPVRLQIDPFAATLDHSHAIRIGAYEEKNYGLFKDASKTMALTWLDTATKRPDPVGTSGNELTLDQKRGKWHNSANLLPLQGGNGDLLGLMHMHADTEGKTEFSYGYDYTQRFYRLSGKPPYQLKALGQEFCIRNADGRCESVQMIMSMMQTASGDILVSYGVNDCETRMATVSLASILQDMSPLQAGERAAIDVMQVPEAQPLLMELAELVSPAPIWVYDQDETKAPAYSAGLQLHDTPHLLESDFYESCTSAAGPYGDWPVCNDWLPTACVAYNFGIANEWELSNSLAAHHGCQVHAFDPSTGHAQQNLVHNQKNVTLNFMGLSSGANESSAATRRDDQHGYGSVASPLRRLDLIMASFGHAAVDVVKIDCEGCEWESLSSVVQAAPESLNCVHVLLVELHFAKRSNGNHISMTSAGRISHHLQLAGWKVWFAVQRGWGSDRAEQELFDWFSVGGDSAAYNVGLVNTRFDSRSCSRSAV